MLCKLNIQFNEKNTLGSYDLLVVLTNNLVLAASTIAQIYKARWHVDLFFKWIKQNLKIKSFLGTSKNAGLSKIWVAMIYTRLLAYLKAQSKFDGSILCLSRKIIESLFFRDHLIDILGLSPKKPPDLSCFSQISFC